MLCNHPLFALLAAMPVVRAIENVVTVDSFATQSSTCYGGDAWKAIDGNTNGNWSGGSITTTCGEAGENWFKLHLGRIDIEIAYVEIFSRTECCQNRLSDTKLEILDSNGAVLATETLSGEADHYRFDVNKRALSLRLVRDTTSADKILSLAEMKVWGRFVQSTESPTESPISPPRDYYFIKNGPCNKDLTYEDCKAASESLGIKWDEVPVPNKNKPIAHMPGGCFAKAKNTHDYMKIRYNPNGDPGTNCGAETANGQIIKYCVCYD